MVNPTFCRTVLHKINSVGWTFIRLIALAFACQMSVHAQEEIEDTWATVDEAVVEQSQRYTQRRVGYYTFNDIVMSGEPELSDNLRLVITESSHNVLDAHGIDENANPYLYVTSLTEPTQIFFEAKRGDFSYSVELQQLVEPAPEAVVFNYDFNVSQIPTNNNWEGWVYPAQNRGVVTFEEAMGNDGSAAYSYEDTSTNRNIAQTGIRFNNRTNRDNINPWTDLLGDAQGKGIQKVTLWVKVEKAIPADVTVQHHLVPFPLIDGTKGNTIKAGIAVGPQYNAVIPASANGTWVQVDLVDTKTNSEAFIIPTSWVHFDGASAIQVYPEILFGNLEVGDKVYVDNYQASILDAGDIVHTDDGTGGTGGDTGGTGGDTGGTGGDTGGTGGDTGGTGGDTGGEVGSISTFTHNFDADEVAESQGKQGWVETIKDRGIIGVEIGSGRNSTSALTFTDNSPNINPEQTGIFLQDWSANPFSAAFGATHFHGDTLTSVSVWVKTELESEKDVQLIHHLLPYGLVSGNKATNIAAATAASPRLVGTIPAGSTDWVKVDFVIEGTDSANFTVPSNWVHNTGAGLNIYPEFKFGNTVEGDKVYFDDYEVISVVGDALPLPTDFAFDYNFNDATASQNGGWGFVLVNYGTITTDTGFQDTNAISYVDTNASESINNQSLLWHKWGATNPWSNALAGASHGKEIETVTLRVKVEKASGNIGTDDVTIKHHLLPWNVTLDGGKLGKVSAAQAITADYTATVEAADFGEWIEVTFIDAKTDLPSFTVPNSWVLTTGNNIVDVLPSFFFGGLEVGDKIIIDDYNLTGDAASVDTGGDDGDGSGGGTGIDYGTHDGSGTYTENPRPEPLAVVDSDFYTEPVSFNVTRNVVDDYSVNNTDAADDTVLMQQALDQISVEFEGGKLVIPAGHYYVRSLHLRSNVHLEVDEGAVFHITPGGGYNVWMFEMGNGNQGKAENFSLVGLGNGFTVDLRDAPNVRTAVFKMGDIENFKFSNFKIEDNKTVFASFLVGITERDDDIFWPVNGIIEKIDQRNSLFGYGLIQTYAADNILFRDLHSEGGIALRLETDNLTMKEKGKGGIRSIFAEDIRCTDGLTAVMFGPHFQENGSVQVDGVTSNGCGFGVRVDDGYVELFSPQGQTFTRTTWREAVETEIGEGCAANPYRRGANQWAARINPVNDCLDVAHQKYGLKPGWFEESYVYNVTVNYGTNAHLKQDQLDYFNLNNQSCENVCLPTTEQWPTQGNIYLGPSIGGSIDDNKPGVDYNFNINIQNLQMLGFPDPHHINIDGDTSSSRVCNYYGMAACPVSRWE